MRGVGRAAVPTRVVESLQMLNRRDQVTLAERLERWLRSAKIDFASPPMLGEDEAAGVSETD